MQNSADFKSERFVPYFPSHVRYIMTSKRIFIIELVRYTYKVNLLLQSYSRVFLLIKGMEMISAIIARHFRKHVPLQVAHTSEERVVFTEKQRPY